MERVEHQRTSGMLITHCWDSHPEAAAKYAETGGLAVFLILESGGGLQMSVDLPQHDGQLDLENEFFLKNWGGSDRAAHVCVQEGLFLPVDKQAVQAGERHVTMSRLDHDMLREMTSEEIEKYTP